MKSKINSISVSDLEQWSDQRNSQAVLPRLLRKLILTTSKDILSINLPAEDNVSKHGYDGIVERTNATHIFIPEGISVWEISVQKTITSKANDDYIKRTQNPLTENPQNTTFIFATTRTFPDKDKWIAEKKQKGNWKDIKVIDAEDICTWLDASFTTHQWFLNELGKNSHIKDLSRCWEIFQINTSKAFNTDFIYNSRVESEKLLIDWLHNTPSELIMRSETFDELVGFLYSVLERNSMQNYIDLCFIIDNENDILDLLKEETPLIIIHNISKPYSSERHHILRYTDTSAILNLKFLEKLKRYPLEESLQKFGLSRIEARNKALQCSGSLFMLQNLLDIYQNFNWTNTFHLDGLTPLLFFHSWDNRNDKDKSQISSLLKTDYPSIESKIRRYIHSNNSPIEEYRNIYRLNAPQILWKLMNGYITDDNMKQFEGIALSVLSEINAKYDDDSGNNSFPFFTQSKAVFSEVLRQGIAKTIAIISILPNNDLTTLSRRIIKTLFKQCKEENNGKLLASLSEYFSEFAEAAPEIFLYYMVEFISNQLILSLFRVQKAAIFPTSLHHHLLWALERLAWNPDYFGQVTELLVKLTALDPDGSMANSPLHTLQSLFIPRFPQTRASFSDRLKCLQRIFNESPSIGWNLLIFPFKRGMSAWMQNSSPEYHDDWIGEFPIPFSNKELTEYIYGLMKLIVEKVDGIIERWADIIDLLDHLPDDTFEILLQNLSSYVKSLNNDNEKVIIKETLRKMISDHQKFHESDWAMEAERVEKIEEVFNQINIENVIQKYKWIFDYNPAIFNMNMDDYNGTNERIKAERIVAIKEILKEKNAELIIELAKESKAPHFLGNALANIESFSDDSFLLNSFATQNDENIDRFFFNYLIVKSNILGDKYLEKFISKDTLKQYGTAIIIKIAISLYPDQFLFALLRSLEIEEEYWMKMDKIYWIQPAESEYAINKLIEHKRPWTAYEIILHIINPSTYESPISIELMDEVLYDAIYSTPEEYNKPSSLDAYHIFLYINTLRKSGKVSDEKLSNYEWVFIRSFSISQFNPISLNRRLANHPEFFKEVFNLIVNPSKEENDNAILHALTLLDSWSVIPGQNEKQDIDRDFLFNWVDTVKKSYTDQSVIDHFYNCLGKVLSQSPIDKDGLWPHQAVREVIEYLNKDSTNDSLNDSIYVGRRNQRGVVQKSIDEGGTQERELADKYNIWAEGLQMNYPTIASILRMLAKSYIREADESDIDADIREYNY